MHAFHSPMVEPILDAFTDVVTKVTLRAPEIPYISNVTGQWATADLVTDPAYWSRHLRGTVRFSEGIDCLLRDQNAVFLEIGPGRTLSHICPSAFTMEQAVFGSRNAAARR